jgi:hypothetical protein
VDVEVLEGVVAHAVARHVAVVMTTRAASAAEIHFVGEQLAAARHLRRVGGRGELPQRIRHEPRLVLAPEDLLEGHVVVADLESLAAELRTPDRARVLLGLLQHERVARAQALRLGGLREQRRAPLGHVQLAVAC